ncbi:ATP-binding protein [Enterococcus sp. AZ196]|uniref:ATP-binding protein n=1 Tax=Enterococcus sp. AZ196 TaxID=2774659 RepID=UPI003D2BD359
MPIKLKQVIIENVKNVEYGEILFKEKEKFLNVVGIYGQNGSGKTTLVDVLEIIRKLILNDSLNELDSGMLNASDATITITIEDVDNRIIRYILVLRKVVKENQEVIQVQKEEIQTRILEKYKPTKTVAIFNRDSDELVSFNINEAPASKDALNVILDVITENKSSFLFSSSFIKLISEKEKLNELLESINILKAFSDNLRIYTSEYAGLISANIFAPVGVHFKMGDANIHGILPFRLRGPESYVPKRMLTTYENVIRQMNIILPEIIPGLSLSMIQKDTRVNQKGEEEVQLGFLSNRGEKRFSLVYESDGIKKIIGLVSYLIEVYNNPSIIAVIDELDSGVYEYLLGEIISVMSTGAKGQLIFTSHNLRVLEVLETNKIIASTSNPMNRYIKLRHVKESNNLRDLYLRTIQLGGQKEELYQGKSSADLRIAFMKAGKMVD